MTQVTIDNGAAVQNLYEAIAAGDVRRLADEILAPDIEWIEPATLPHGGTHLGADAVLGNVLPHFSAVWGEAFEMQRDTLLGAGDTIVVQGYYSGTSPDDHAYEIPFCHVLRVRDGRIAKLQAYLDTALAPWAAQT